MKKEITLVAELRTARGKNEARRLRASGRIPAVVYGAGQESIAVSLDAKQVQHVLMGTSGRNSIVQVDIAGHQVLPAMIADWQHEPVKDTLMHVDLEWIDMTRKMTVRIPIRLEGEPRGVKQQGGLLDAVTRELEIECLPADIPEFVTVDVTPLRLGQALRASEVPLGEGITLKSHPETVVCHVVAPKKAEVGAPAEGAVAVEGEGEAPAAPGAPSKE